MNDIYNLSNNIINTIHIKRTPTNGVNIYDSYNYKLNKLYLDNLCFNRYMLARYPMQSGLIPNYYNQIKEAEKETIRFNNDYFNNIANKEINNLKYQETDKIIESFSNFNLLNMNDLTMNKNLLIFIVVFILLFFFIIKKFEFLN